MDVIEEFLMLIGTWLQGAGACGGGSRMKTTSMALGRFVVVPDAV